MYSYPLKLYLKTAWNKERVDWLVYDSNEKTILFVENVGNDLQALNAYSDSERKHLLYRLTAQNNGYQCMSVDNAMLGSVEKGGCLRSMMIPTYIVNSSEKPAMVLIKKQTGLFSYWSKKYIVSYLKQRIGKITFKGSLKSGEDIMLFEKTREFPEEHQGLILIGAILSSYWELSQRAWA